jgi:hypothetical protein
MDDGNKKAPGLGALLSQQKPSPDAESATTGNGAPLQEQDKDRVEEGGPDAAFATRNTAGGTGNQPAGKELLESAEVGADVQTELNDQSNDALAAGAVREAAYQAEDSSGQMPAGKTWTSHPIQNYSLGRFDFQQGILNLTESADIEEFEKLLNHPQLPIRDKQLIQEVNVDRANRIASEFVKSRVSSGITHSETGDTK